MLARIRARKDRRSERRETQAYRCVDCGGWHLSGNKPKPSKTERTD